MPLPAVSDNITHQLMLQTLGKAKLPMPFSRSVFLMGTHVAGTGFYEAAEAAKHLKIGEQLVLKREPDNPYDDMAIAVLGRSGNQFGYIPRNRNGVLARLMDAGKQITAEISGCDAEDHWPDIDIDVSMSEI